MSRIVPLNFDPQEVIHPDDDAVIHRLNEIPGFKALLQKTVTRFTETITAITYTGNGYRITEQSVPQLYNRLKEDCRILGVADVPHMSALWSHSISSQSVGEKNHQILLASGAIDLLTPEELDFLIGHELGHFLCGHISYHMFVEALYAPLFKNTIASDIVGMIKFPLLKWYRISHYSADRVGLLCCQDINVALSTMIKMAGLPKKYYGHVDVKEFIKQADEFAVGYSGTMNKLMKNLVIQSAESPWMVMRAKQLITWYEEGAYHEIVNRQ